MGPILTAPEPTRGNPTSVFSTKFMFLTFQQRCLRRQQNNALPTHFVFNRSARFMLMMVRYESSKMFVRVTFMSTLFGTLSCNKYHQRHSVKSFIKLTRTTILNYSKTTRHILFIDVSASRRKPSSGLTSGASCQYVKAGWD